MATSLAAAFITSNAQKNFAVPGDTVTFKFNNPPATATNVLISVLETVEFLDSSKAKVTDNPIGGFRGHITNGKFQVESILGAPLPAIPDPVTIRVATSLDPGSPHMFANMPEPEQVQSHTLRLRITGTVSGTNQTFENRSLLNMEYPLAMVIPRMPATHDPSLPLVNSWSLDQWLAFKPDFRHVEQVKTLRFTRDIIPGDYDEWIAAFVACAKKATSGVIAMATGHGDGGFDSGHIPWCNLVPEDFPPPVVTKANPNPPFLYHLDIDQNVLAFGVARPDGIVRVPPLIEKIKLNALDRLCDALQGLGLRRIILHTCHAGLSTTFMQFLADRIQIPIMAHTKEITYGVVEIRSDTTNKVLSHNILATYDNDNPVTPRDLQFWPVSNLAGPVRPGARPKRFTV